VAVEGLPSSKEKRGKTAAAVVSLPLINSANSGEHLELELPAAQIEDGAAGILSNATITMMALHRSLAS
jgi:hypothetical protein